MPRRTSFLSILLVLAMTAAALTPWAAAASGGLALVTSGQEAASQTVGFTGVPGLPEPPGHLYPLPVRPQL